MTSSLSTNILATHLYDTMIKTLVLVSLNLTLFFCSAIALASVSEAQNLTNIKMCVWDPIGKSGPAEQIMKEAKLDYFGWGVDLDYEIYSDERIPIEEFKLGRCDMVNMLGFRAREFNAFTGSLGAIGATPSYEHLGVIIKTLSSKGAAKLMRVGDYEIVGIMPAGAIFVFTRDRSMLLPSDFGGKRMAVLDNLPETSYLTKKHGITPVNSTIINSLLKFNNGKVDLTAGPAIVYEPFELYKGLEPNGGIYARPSLFITMQIVARANKLPPGVGQLARERWMQQYPKFVKYVKDPESTIPDKYWIHLPEEQYSFWAEDYRQSRMALSEKGIYDRRALKLLRKVRCKLKPDLAECSAETKE